MKIVLVIAGFDPSAGAGILADVKTVSALGCYATAAVTSLTFQNTLGVFGAEHQTASTLASQIEPIFDDFDVAAIKTGMLPTADAVDVTSEAISKRRHVPTVIDPVVRSTSGFDLVDDAALGVIVSRLFPLASVVTPNILEAERITGVSISTTADMERAARELVRMGASAALVTGGHLDAHGMAVDVLFDGREMVTFSDERIESTSTHGTGCTLASAIAAHLALGRDLPAAVAEAKAYVSKAIRSAPRLGHGHGPLDHFHSREKQWRQSV